MIRGIDAKDLVKKPILKDSLKNVNMEDFHGDNVFMGIVWQPRWALFPGTK